MTVWCQLEATVSSHCVVWLRPVVLRASSAHFIGSPTRSAEMQSSDCISMTVTSTNYHYHKLTVHSKHCRQVHKSAKSIASVRPIPAESSTQLLCGGIDNEHGIAVRRQLYCFVVVFTFSVTLLSAPLCSLSLWVGLVV